MSGSSTPTRRAAAAAHARGGVGERLGDAAADLAKAGLSYAGHTALDLAAAGGKAAARNPKEFAPPAAAAGVLAAAEGASREAALGWPLLFGALVLAGYLLYRRDKRAARSLLRRAYYVLAYTAALVYLAAAAAQSPTAPAAVDILAAGALATTGTWWARHLRRRVRTTAAAPAPQDEFADLREEITAWWAERAAPERGGFAPGSAVLGEARVDEIAYRLDIQLDGNRQSFDDLASLQCRKRIAAGRGIARQRVLVTRWGDQREDRATLTLFRKYLVQENVPFPGPRIDPVTGCATVGRCADGSPALVRFWEPKSGTWHEVVAGGSGAGKSRYLDQALVNERHCLDTQGRHLIVSWVCDPQGGQSLPDWQERVDEYAHDAAEALALVERIYAEMLARNKLLAKLKWTDSKGNARTGLSYYDPVVLAELGEYLPILSATLEEAPSLLANPRIKWLVEQILKMGRKCGIRLRLVCQVPSIAELGNSFTIRPLLAFMSVVCLRTTEAITNSSFPNLPGDPKLLEETFPNGERTFGLGYILGAVAPALFRTFFLDDVVVYEWATAGTTAHLQPLATAQDAAEARQAQPGADVPLADLARATLHEAVDLVERAEAPAVGTARELIRGYLAKHPGHVTSGALVAELGLNPSTVSQALARDVAAGKILRVTHGVYAALGTDPGLWADTDQQAAA